MIVNRRTVVWFSCGAASAVAAKIAVENGDNVHVVYCDTLAEEHPDNRMFLHRIEEWIEHPIEIIRSEKYATISDVFEQTHYMSGIKGARCTVELKKMPRFAYQEPDDLHVFGLTADESKRIANFEANNPELSLWWNLREFNMTKADCYMALKRAGIALPAMYGLGFKNNNCIGCVKATSAKYWSNVRKNFPAVFSLRARQSRDLGVRLTRIKGVRIFLDELPLDHDDLTPEEDIECGPICLTTSDGDADG
jgi:3'-phosphoadenosine 5'-phosphosulfate sulfotransferase (PAPS reductase)/FAD synthetase